MNDALKKLTRDFYVEARKAFPDLPCPETQEGDDKIEDLLDFIASELRGSV